jgi:hypothetical protein
MQILDTISPGSRNQMVRKTSLKFKFIRNIELNEILIASCCLSGQWTQYDDTDTSTHEESEVLR